MVSVADITGRFIKIFDTLTFVCLHSFKRGLNPCTIASTSFSADGKYLAVSGSSDTVHVFELEAGSLGMSLQLESDSFREKKGLHLLDSFKSYFTDVLSLASSSMKLHLKGELGCSWVAKEGTLAGPMAAFGRKNKLVTPHSP